MIDSETLTGGAVVSSSSTLAVLQYVTQFGNAALLIINVTIALGSAAFLYRKWRDYKKDRESKLENRQE